MARRTIPQAKSSILGAWPGRLGGVGKLPYPWTANTRGLVIDIVRVNLAINGIEFVEARFWSIATTTGLALIYLTPRIPVEMPVQPNVAVTLPLAITGGNRNNVAKAHLGVETRDGNGSAIEAPTAEIIDWQKLGPRITPVTAVVTLAGGAYTTAMPFLGLEVTTGAPVDITLQIGSALAAAGP